jgi:hypothetical protein
MFMVVFCVVTPCGLVDEYERFRRNILPRSSGLKMGTVCFSETLVSTYKSTRRYSPEDQHRHDNKPSDSIKGGNSLTI